jgi:mevalonate kinase
MTTSFLNATFTTTVHAKCILTGEHAVLHGATAIAFPLRGYAFTLQFESCDNYELQADSEGDFSQELGLCFWPALEKCLEMLGHTLAEISGRFVLKNNMPVGAGLGFSACVCVAIARWLCFMGWITDKQIFHFAHKCESLFHGVSSGVDVAAVMSHQPIIYVQNKPVDYLKSHWKPALYISNAQKSSLTTRAVATTEHLWQSDQACAKRLCDRMQQASQLALQSFNDENVELLKNAIDQACSCYHDWGLINGALKDHIALLSQYGAMAIKPTGSGGEGGHVLSLWSMPIPVELNNSLKPVFMDI